MALDFTQISYTGQRVNNIRQGYGEATWPDNGTKYIGEWLNDLPEGYGVLTAPDQEYRGEWHLGFYHGRGSLQTAAWTYVGEWVNGKRDGFSYEIMANGDKFYANYKNDKMHGQALVFGHSNSVSAMNYVDDKISSPVIRLGKENIASQCSVVNGKQHGMVKYIGPNGMVFTTKNESKIVDYDAIITNKFCRLGAQSNDQPWLVVRDKANNDTGFTQHITKDGIKSVPHVNGDYKTKPVMQRIIKKLKSDPSRVEIEARETIWRYAISSSLPSYPAAQPANFKPVAQQMATIVPPVTRPVATVPSSPINNASLEQRMLTMEAQLSSIWATKNSSASNVPVTRLVVQNEHPSSSASSVPVTRLVVQNEHPTPSAKNAPLALSQNEHPSSSVKNASPVVTYPPPPPVKFVAPPAPKRPAPKALALSDEANLNSLTSTIHRPKSSSLREVRCREIKARFTTVDDSRIYFNFITQKDRSIAIVPLAQLNSSFPLVAGKKNLVLLVKLSSSDSINYQVIELSNKSEWNKCNFKFDSCLNEKEINNACSEVMDYDHSCTGDYFNRRAALSKLSEMEENIGDLPLAVNNNNPLPQNNNNNLPSKANNNSPLQFPVINPPPVTSRVNNNSPLQFPVINPPPVTSRVNNNSPLQFPVINPPPVTTISGDIATDQSALDNIIFIDITDPKPTTKIVDQERQPDRDESTSDDNFSNDNLTIDDETSIEQWNVTVPSGGDDFWRRLVVEFRFHYLAVEFFAHATGFNAMPSLYFYFPTQKRHALHHWLGPDHVMGLAAIARGKGLTFYAVIIDNATKVYSEQKYKVAWGPDSELKVAFRSHKPVESIEAIELRRMKVLELIRATNEVTNFSRGTKRKSPENE